MSIEGSSWLKQLCVSQNLVDEPLNSRPAILRCFLQSISALNISPEQIGGNVLVIGPGPVFPESALLFTEESGFSKKRPEIRSITCCDCENTLVPGSRCVPLPRIDFDLDRKLQKEDFIHTFYGWANELLRELPPGFFDTVLDFRLKSLEETLLPEDYISGNNLIYYIKHVLTSGGHFIGSGSCEDDIFPIKEFFFQGLKILNCTDLPLFTPIGTGGNLRFYPQHIGIIVEKQ